VAKVPPDERTRLAPLLDFPKRFEKAMDDDFNTALAIGHLYDMARILNWILHHPGQDPALELSLLAMGSDCFKTHGAVLGLFQFKPDAYLERKREKRLVEVSLKESEIKRFVKERELARKAKDWKRADEIRENLADHNVVLEDGPDGTRWRIVQ
jgi:cysteinyl-tRNA synthetase